MGTERSRLARRLRGLRLCVGSLFALGYKEFLAPRDKLWTWIRDFQLPDLAKDGMLWVQFFEDHSEPDNRTAWAPLNLARYLLEKKEALDGDWQKDAKMLM
jgi:hypothetical protein